jgi:hypothetical protein
MRLSTGQTVPIIRPEVRGMSAWTVAELVNKVTKLLSAKSGADYADPHEEITNFLERIYYEFRNLGISAQERALNYAATNALLFSKKLLQEAEKGFHLDEIEVQRSPICRPDSDCWDVVLKFYDPQKVFEKSRHAIRFTVDVSYVNPVILGEPRSWYIR